VNLALGLIWLQRCSFLLCLFAPCCPAADPTLLQLLSVQHSCAASVCDTKEFHCFFSLCHLHYAATMMFFPVVFFFLVACYSHKFSIVFCLYMFPILFRFVTGRIPLSSWSIPIVRPGYVLVSYAIRGFLTNHESLLSARLSSSANSNSTFRL